MNYIINNAQKEWTQINYAPWFPLTPYDAEHSSFVSMLEADDKMCLGLAQWIYL